MLLYSHTSTPRLRYVVRFLARYYGVNVAIVTSVDVFKKATDTCKIAYHAQAISATDIWIAPHSLLFETGVKPLVVDCFDYNGTVAFFKADGAIPFDILAATFFLLSRYEEYGPHQKDMYGRYAHQNAIAFKHNFLKSPVINRWLEAFRAVLAQKDARFAQPAHRFVFEPTYDIDIAWSYKAKGPKRTAGGVLKSMAQGNGNQLFERMKVLSGATIDPYDAYDWLNHLHTRFGLKPLYFFLVAQRRGRYDKNSSIHSNLFQNLIRQTAQQHRIGLHPSWQSGDIEAALQQEKTYLEKQVQQPISLSRQHYIRFALPQTYRCLLAAGITDDYSMGYGSINGFRASVATPFFWFDLEREEETPLLLHPFCFMDANAYYEQRQTAAETAAELQSFYTAVKEVNGTLTTIWHNHFLGTDAAFAGWRSVYEAFVKQCAAGMGI